MKKSGLLILVLLVVMVTVCFAEEKSTKDISLTMYTAMFIGVALWFVFGVSIQSISMMLANGITALLLLIMIGLKLKYK